jgi:membrane-bound lytic murein transglycosylase B
MSVCKRISYIIFYIICVLATHNVYAEFKSMQPIVDDPRTINLQEFQSFLQEISTQAISKGIKKTTLENVLPNIQPNNKIIAFDRKQNEFTTRFEDYFARVTNDVKVNKAVDYWQNNKDSFYAIEQKYKVEPSIILALWATETDFGQNTGDFNVVNALATLAYDGRRAELFKAEFLNALQILDEGHISQNNMKGSWAGAMGQCQFMPSSFLKYAVDADGDGHKNIWTSKIDTWNSIANYLATVGWQYKTKWGDAVSRPEGGEDLYNFRNKKSASEWTNLGILRLDRQLFNKQEFAVIYLDRTNSDVAFATYKNFDVLMDWNRSYFFGVSVASLANKIQSKIDILN